MGYAKKVHVIDDDAAVRGALDALLTAEGYAVRTYPSARSFLDANDACDCVVTDVRMPDMSGIELVARMKALKRQTPIIVITAYGDVRLAVQAMKSGAADFIEKPFDDEDLLEPVRSALSADSATPARTGEEKAIRERLATLTCKESAVLAAIVEGKLNKVIAQEFNVSVRTIETHRANIMAKLQAGGLSELVRMFLLVGRDTTDI